jgi:hypothetical protein
MQNILEEIKDTDDAFLSAVTPKEINGRELQPFSLMREVIAQEFIGAEASMFFAAVMRVYVCTLDPRAIVKLRSDREQTVIDAFAWAESQGFSFNNWEPLREIYKTLSDEIAQSLKVKSDNSEDDPIPNAGRQPE